MRSHQLELDFTKNNQNEEPPKGASINDVTQQRIDDVFSVDLVCKEELNLLLEISDFKSRCSGPS